MLWIWVICFITQNLLTKTLEHMIFGMQWKNAEKKTNFIIIPFDFTGHANYLIYESKRKELERFDPNRFTTGESYNPPNLEKN